MLSFTAMHMKSEEIHKAGRCLKDVAVHTASIWPWFSVNDLLYIFVILYKRENGLFKKKRERKKWLHWLCLYSGYTPEPWN